MRKPFAFVASTLLFGAAVAACGSESTAVTPSPAGRTPAVDPSSVFATPTPSGAGSAATIVAQASPAAATTPSQAAQQLATAPAPQTATATATDTPTTSGAIATTPVVGGPQPGSQPPGARTVSLADDGKTISLAPGETFLLALGDGAWSPEIDNQAVVSRVMNIAVVRGAQGVYSAHSAGTAHMTAQNGSITFRLTIVVK